MSTGRAQEMQKGSGWWAEVSGQFIVWDVGLGYSVFDLHLRFALGGFLDSSNRR